MTSSPQMRVRAAVDSGRARRRHTPRARPGRVKHVLSRARGPRPQPVHAAGKPLTASLHSALIESAAGVCVPSVDFRLRNRHGVIHLVGRRTECHAARPPSPFDQRRLGGDHDSGCDPADSLVSQQDRQTVTAGRVESACRPAPVLTTGGTDGIHVQARTGHRRSVTGRPERHGRSLDS